MKYFSVLFFWEHGFFLHGRQTDHKHLKYVSCNWPICLGLVPHLACCPHHQPGVSLAAFPAGPSPPKARSFMHWLCEPPKRHKFTGTCENLQDWQGCWGFWGPFRSFITSHRYLSLIIIASALGSTTSVLPFEQLFPVRALEIACFHLWSLLQTPNTAEFNLLSGPRDIMLMCAHASWVVLEKRHRKQSRCHIKILLEHLASLSSTPRSRRPSQILPWRAAWQNHCHDAKPLNRWNLKHNHCTSSSLRILR